MTTPIFYIKEGNLSFADKHILSDLDLYIYPGDKICLVGRNGSGKSSLMKIIEGEYELDSGELFKDPMIRIGYLKQDMTFKQNSRIYDFVLAEVERPEENKHLADIILNKLQIDGNLELKNCSGGQVRRAFLAKALVNQTEILLLDEPTNHLDIAAIGWLEEYVKSYLGAIVCISHDRRFQENVTNKVWWIDRGELRKSNRGFKYYDQWREEIIAEEEAVLRKMNRKLEAEKGWLNGGVTARRKRNQKRLANLYRLREQLRVHESKLTSAKAKLQIELLQEAKKTQFIIEAEGVSFGYGGEKTGGEDHKASLRGGSAGTDAAISEDYEDHYSWPPEIASGITYPRNDVSSPEIAAATSFLFTNFNFKVKKGEKIGVIGPNGSGKSTFVKLLIKELVPTIGKIKHGTNLEITYFDQNRTHLNKDHTIKLTLCPGGGDQVFLKNRHMHVAAYLKNFMFDPRIVNDKVGTLSGGEANRLLIAKALISPGNFLILDEPTNDLDMDSLEMLLEILADYDGTLLVISHDRDFLNRLVTRTLVFTGEEIVDLYGGYDDYLKFYKPGDNKNNSSSNVKKKVGPVVEEVKQLPKLSYKYQRLLEVLPHEIEALELRIKELENKLMQADLYSQHPKDFDRYSKELEVSKLLLDKKIQQWIEVENMR
jgi:ATP-binding cassette subfamily F protein uup